MAGSANDITAYLRLMVAKDGSDLYFSAGAPVHLSIHGETYPVGQHVLDGREVRELAYSLLSDDQKAEFERSLELNLAVGFDDLGRFRVNVYRQRGDLAMVVRYIKSDIPSIESLGLPLLLQQLILEKMGLILVVGATGSGKSTTLASMIDYRNAHASGHILTIEDPIEFVPAQEIDRRPARGGSCALLCRRAQERCAKRRTSSSSVKFVIAKPCSMPSTTPRPGTSACPPCTPATPTRPSSAS